MFNGRDPVFCEALPFCETLPSLMCETLPSSAICSNLYRKLCYISIDCILLLSLAKYKTLKLQFWKNVQGRSCHSAANQKASKSSSRVGAVEESNRVISRVKTPSGAESLFPCLLCETLHCVICDTHACSQTRLGTPCLL